MIESSSLYLLVNIGSYSDVLANVNTFTFVITETAGNILPSLEGSLQLSPQLIRQIANEGAEIDILVGRTRDSALHSKWRFTTYSLVGSMFSFKARLSIPYTRTRTIEVINDTSINAIKNIASRYFKVNDMTTGFADKMKWVCYNLDHWSFINEIWLYSFKSTSSLLVPAITMDGQFLLKDVLDVKKSFTVGPYEGYDYSAEMPIQTVCDASKYHELLGSSSDWTINDDTGVNSLSDLALKPVFGAKFNRYQENKSWDQPRYLTEDNVHSDFFLARRSNLGRLALLANYSTVVTLSDYNNLGLLDHVKLTSTIPGTDLMDDMVIGTHFVRQRMTRITNNATIRRVELARDAITIPGINGDLP